MQSGRADLRNGDQVVVKNDECQDVFNEQDRLAAGFVEEEVPHLVTKRVLNRERTSASFSDEMLALTVRMNAPTDDPTERASSRPNRKTICTFTIRSTAVRLIGAELRVRASAPLIQTANHQDPRSVAHQLRLMTGEDHQTVHPGRVAQLSPSQHHLVRRQRHVLLRDRPFGAHH